MPQSSRDPRPPDFDALLWEVIDAPPSEVDSILARCPDRELRAAVRKVLALEEVSGEIPRRSQPTRPSLRPGQRL
jgi:hypothetical protein